MNEKFEIIIADDAQHEKVYAEIHFDEKFVAIVSQDEGIDRLTLETPGSVKVEDLVLRKVDLNEFLKAVEAAKLRLIGKP